MQQNYLHSAYYQQLNAFLAAAAGWNLKKMMTKLKEEFLFYVFELCQKFKILFYLNKIAHY
mgnify:FL=1